MTNTNNMSAAELYAYHAKRGAELVEAGYGWTQLMADVDSVNDTMREIYLARVRNLFANSKLSSI